MQVFKHFFTLDNIFIEFDNKALIEAYLQIFGH